MQAYQCPTRDFAILMATTLITIGIGIDNGRGLRRVRTDQAAASGQKAAQPLRSGRPASPAADCALLLACLLACCRPGIYTGIGISICDLLLRASYPQLKPCGEEAASQPGRPRSNHISRPASPWLDSWPPCAGRVPGTSEWRTLERYKVGSWGWTSGYLHMMQWRDVRPSSADGRP